MRNIKRNKQQIEQAKEEEEKLSKIKPKIFDRIEDWDESNIEEELSEINEFYDKESTRGIQPKISVNNPPFIIHHDKQEDMEKDEQKDKDDWLNDSWRDDESEMFDDDEILEDEREEIEMEYEMLVWRVKDADENQFFKKAMSKLYTQNPEEMNNLVNQLSEKQKQFMKKLLQTQRLTISENGETKQITRRVVKAKRRNE